MDADRDANALERRLLLHAGLLAAGVACAVPSVFSLAGGDPLARGWPRLAPLVERNGPRLVSGYACLAFVIFQGLLSARKRAGLTLGIELALWRSAHIGAGLVLMGAVLAHTGGRWGWHLNGWLTAAGLVTALGGLAGNLVEEALTLRLMRHAHAAGRRAESRRRPAGAPARRASPAGEAAVAPVPLHHFRRAWTTLHLGGAAILAVLLVFHVLAAHYF
jgi:hypothetical protein